MGSDSLWVFGYGSLCWRPGFDYAESKIGYIRGFVRRFWQGNTTHRGVNEQPGRVATLVENKNAITYGVAFELRGESALEYLNGREVTLGGYKTILVDFYVRGTCHPSGKALLYIATPESRHWLGPAPLEHIASQVLAARGAAGHNVEYLLRLAEFLRDQVPESQDEHLNQLERLVRRGISDHQMCLQTLMGQETTPARRASADVECEAIENRRTSFQFADSLTTKKLRCLKM